MFNEVEERFESLRVWLKHVTGKSAVRWHAECINTRTTHRTMAEVNLDGDAEGETFPRRR